MASSDLPDPEISANAVVLHEDWVVYRSQFVRLRCKAMAVPGVQETAVNERG